MLKTIPTNLLINSFTLSRSSHTQTQTNIEMGTLLGHVLPGLGFFAIGLWHLFNHVKMHATNSISYKSSPWFPTRKLRYLELFFIIVGTSISISMELFISPEKHQPFDPDGTIPTTHLHNLEHASISLSFLVYATFAIFLDRYELKLEHDQQYSVTQLIVALAFGQEFLLFHLHSTDHKGVEGQYHLLLQNVILVCLATTLMGIDRPRSFLISFIRSIGVMFQGVWLVVMGYMLWTPAVIPKGCFIHSEDSHEIVRCSSEEALYRAKSLVNIQFCWYITGITIFSTCFYVFIVQIYTKKVKYSSLAKELDDIQKEDIDDQSF